MRASYDKAEHLHHRLPGTAFDEAYAPVVSPLPVALGCCFGALGGLDGTTFSCFRGAGSIRPAAPGNAPSD